MQRRASRTVLGIASKDPTIASPPPRPWSRFDGVISDGAGSSVERWTGPLNTILAGHPGSVTVDLEAISAVGL